MKKRIASLLLTCFLLGAMIVPTQAAQAGLTGSSKTVKPGDTVVITLIVSGEIEGFQAGAVSCSSNMTYTGFSSAKSDWEVDSNQGQSFLGYDKNVEPDGGALMNMTFKVSSSAKAGEELSVKLSNVVLASGSESSQAHSHSWTGSVAAPPSTNCDLKAIECYSGTMKPAFNKDTTYYTVTVPYSVDKLSFDYFRADQTQTVSVSGGTLAVGENTITFTVKAASGATKTYTLVAIREQDPNYEPSKDASLKEMTLEGATLSPAFDPAITEYVAYVPFEQTSLTLRGVANDAKAVGVAEKKIELDPAENVPAFEGVADPETGLVAPVTTYAAQDNVATLTCTAEDGVTQQTYTVHIVRMPAYTGGVPQIHMTNEDDLLTADDTEPEDIPEEEKPIEVPAKVALPLVGEMSTRTVAIAGGAVAVVLMLLIGFLLGRIGRRKAVYEDDEYDEETDEEPVDEPAVEEEPVRPAKPEKPAKPVKKGKKVAYDFDEDDEFERLLEGAPAAEHKAAPQSEVKQETPVEPAKPAQPEKAAPVDDDVSHMSLDDLLDDIRNM